MVVKVVLIIVGVIVGIQVVFRFSIDYDARNNQIFIWYNDLFDQVRKYKKIKPF